MTVRVIAASSHLQPVREGEALPSLEQALKEVSREHFRRVDRFIQLALVGSGRCVAGQALRPDCGVYLGSGFGPIGSNILTQEQMLRDHEIPKPFNFVNTLGASAGYHVAKNLGLTGQNFFVSRRGASLEAALETALLDLEMGVVSQALVGVVEEVTLPLGQHRLRRGMPAEMSVAEGSHWLLLEKRDSGGKALRLMRFEDVAELEAYLHAHYSVGDHFYRAQQDDAAAIGTLAQRFVTQAKIGEGIHDNMQAAWVARFLVDDTVGSLFLIGCGEDYGLLHLGA